MKIWTLLVIISLVFCNVLKSPLGHAPRLKVQVWRLALKGQDSQNKARLWWSPEAQSLSLETFHYFLKITIIRVFPFLLTKKSNLLSLTATFLVLTSYFYFNYAFSYWCSTFIYSVPHKKKKKNPHFFFHLALKP